MEYILIAIGLAGLFGGGEILLRGAVGLALRLSVPPMIIGLTIVGFGTSVPELVTSLEAAFRGSPGIAVGNVVGSNIGNVLLILGVAALIRPMTSPDGSVARDGTALLLATAAAIAIALTGEAGRLAGATLVAGLAAYLGTMLYLQMSDRAEPGIDAEVAPPLWTAIGLALAGLVVTVLSARALVSGAITLAERAGVSETVLGLTIVAIGTSLPELATSVVAARRGQGDIALGNVIGSNIFNILGILGVTALVVPLEVPAQIAAFDIWVMAGSTVALLAILALTARVGRIAGCLLLLSYIAYVAILGANAGPA